MRFTDLYDSTLEQARSLAELRPPMYDDTIACFAPNVTVGRRLYFLDPGLDIAKAGRLYAEDARDARFEGDQVDEAEEVMASLAERIPSFHDKDDIPFGAELLE